MNWIALVVLTLVGYSTGAALGGRGRIVFPSLLDLGWIVALWIAALLSHSYVGSYLGRWPTGCAWLIVSGLFAFVWTRTRCRESPLARQPPPAEQTSSATAASSATERSLIRRLWAGWKRFAQRMGNFQGRVLLAMFYFIAITPFGILVRLFGDPLRLKRRARSSFWLDRPEEEIDLERVRSQY